MVNSVLERSVVWRDERNGLRRSSAPQLAAFASVISVIAASNLTPITCEQVHPAPCSIELESRRRPKPKRLWGLSRVPVDVGKPQNRQKIEQLEDWGFNKKGIKVARKVVKKLEREKAHHFLQKQISVPFNFKGNLSSAKGAARQQDRRPENQVSGGGPAGPGATEPTLSRKHSSGEAVKPFLGSQHGQVVPFEEYGDKALWAQRCPSSAASDSAYESGISRSVSWDGYSVPSGSRRSSLMSERGLAVADAPYSGGAFEGSDPFGEARPVEALNPNLLKMADHVNGAKGAHELEVAYELATRSSAEPGTTVASEAPPPQPRLPHRPPPPVPKAVAAGQPAVYRSTQEWAQDLPGSQPSYPPSEVLYESGKLYDLPDSQPSYPPPEALYENVKGWDRPQSSSPPSHFTAQNVKVWDVASHFPSLNVEVRRRDDGSTHVTGGGENLARLWIEATNAYWNEMKKA